MASYKLWEIPQAIDLIEDMLVDPETGEVLSEEEANALIDKLEFQKDKKLEYLCKLIKNKKAEADMLREHKRDIDRRIKAADNTIESIKNFINFALNGEKWKAEDGSVSISYRNTKDKVIIDNIDIIPDEYFKKPHDEQHLMKTFVKEVMLPSGGGGQTIPGVHLEDSVSVIIK